MFEVGPKTAYGGRVQPLASTMSRLKSDVGLSGLSKKRKRGDVKSAVKQKTKRYHGQASRIAELEKKVAEMVKHLNMVIKTLFN